MITQWCEVIKSGYDVTCIAIVATVIRFKIENNRILRDDRSGAVVVATRPLPLAGCLPRS